MGMDFDVNVSVKTTGKEIIDNLEKQLDKIKNNSVELKVDLGGILGGNSNVGKQFEDIGKQASISMTKGIKSVKIDNPIDFAKFRKEQETQIKSASAKMQAEINGLSKRSANKYAREYYTKIAKSEKQFSDTIYKIQQEKSKFSLAKSNINSAGTKQLGNLGYEKLTLYINQAEQAQSRLNAELKKGNSANLDNINADLKEFNSLATKAGNEYQKLMNPASAIKQETLLRQTEIWGNKNSKALKAGATQWNNIISSLSNGTLTEGQLQDINENIKRFKGEMLVSGNVGSSWIDNIKSEFGKLSQFLGTYSLIQKSVEYAKEMVVAVKDVNVANIELRKVSNASDFQIGKYFDEAAESAKKYGATISDVINTTADWSRLGFNLDDAKKLSDVTTLYQKVGDNIDRETASQSLISTLKGFGLEADQALSIIDKFNEVSNNYAIDSRGIGEALQRSAASFNAANTDLNKSIALITGTNEVVQNSEKVGQMWKTVGMRIRSTKQELEAAGEDTDGMVESTSELRDLVQSTTGFDIMADKAGTQYKDIYDIVVGIGEEWKNLSDIEQAGLLEKLAGKNHGNALAAAFNNLDTIKSAYNTALNESGGSAEKELANYQKGIEYSIDKFKASFQELSNATINSDFLKGAIDSGTAFVNVLTKIIDVGGGIPAILSAIGTVEFIKNLD